MKTYKNIPWYGPAYLYSNYGNIGSVQNASTVANGTYTVQGGDTLSKIARNLGTSVSNLVAKNNILNPDFIREGQILKY